MLVPDEISYIFKKPDIKGRESFPASHIGQCAGEIGFPDAGRSSDDDILGEKRG
jgi:hypothetical protein